MASSTAEKIRQYTGPVLFERGFRPFFLGAGLFAALIMPLWILVLSGQLDLPGHFSPREWHVHEFLFGYVSAVLCGFLLTAIPNWTGRLPVLGMPLFLLWTVWIMGRVAMLIEIEQQWIIILVESSFLVLLALLAWREVLSGKNYRNLPICILVSIFALANIGFHIRYLYELDTQILENVALAIISILLGLVGGRITPSFTLNWMKKQNLEPLPTPFNRFDQVVMVVSIVALLTWVFVPEHEVAGYGFAIMAIMHFIRISRWRGMAVMREPLLFVLHLGQFWLPLWAILMALTIIWPDQFSGISAIHALTIGSIATMTLVVMMRACLGHTGRPITGGAGTIIIFAAITMAAIIRILVDRLPFDYDILMAFSGTMWSLAFVLFVILMTPVVVTRRTNN